MTTTEPVCDNCPHTREQHASHCEAFRTDEGDYCHCGKYTPGATDHQHILGNVGAMEALPVGTVICTLDHGEWARKFSGDVTDYWMLFEAHELNWYRSVDLMSNIKSWMVVWTP